MERRIHRVVFMGTPDFAVPSLEALIAAGYEVAAVFTQPDKPRGRSGKMAFSPVKEAALAHGIAVYQPVRVRNPENVKILREIDPDVIVVVAFGQILPKEIVELPPYGCINVHGSLLPKYRGAAPVQWAVIDGEKQSGVTIMRMDEGLDTGDMLLKSVCDLAEDETGGSLFERLKEDGARTLVKALQGLEEGSITPEKQPEQSPTPYARMLTKEMGRIDWNKSARSIEQLIRGLDPWPSAWTVLGGRQLKLWKSCAMTEDVNTPVCQAGTVVAVNKDSLVVQTGEGLLKIFELQLEGKKRMDAGAFLRGAKVEEGTVLGTV